MTELKHMPQAEWLDDPARRQTYVNAMFDEIAPQYDRFTRWFSFGMDAAWKRELIAAVLTHAPAGNGTALDLACGTGDLAIAIADARPDINVIGIDAAPTMIAIARSHARVRYEVGDAHRLPLSNAQVMLATVGYGVRNFPNHPSSLHELARVIAIGGVIGILDFTRPRFAPWRWLFLGYLSITGRICGWWWHGHGPVYGYIARSIAAFVTRRQLAADLTAAGFTVLHDRQHLGGGIALLVAKRN